MKKNSVSGPFSMSRSGKGKQKVFYFLPLLSSCKPFMIVYSYVFEMKFTKIAAHLIFDSESKFCTF